MRIVISTTAVSMALFACGGESTQVETPEIGQTVSASSPNPPRMRPCKSDSYFIDFQTALSGPQSMKSFLTHLQSNVEGRANMPGLPWFCGVGETHCPSKGAVSVRLESTLAKRSSPSMRDEGHERFFTLRFVDSTGAPVVVREEAQCSVVSYLRSTAQTAAISHRAPLVGRQCQLSGQGLEDYIDSAMESWHLNHINHPTPSVTHPTIPRFKKNVNLAIVDTGVAKNYSHMVDATSEVDYLPQVGGTHIHGTAMAVLARQIAPDVKIHSYRALGAGGSADGNSVAQAIDHALFGTSTPSTEPLILNLSLGFPPHLRRPTLIAGGTCRSHEDPFGEPIRYLLDIARRLDASGARDISIVAAAGNQPLGPRDDLFFEVSNPQGFHPGISQGPLNGSEWFFPAQWAQEPTESMVDPGGDDTYSVLAVSAVDHESKPAGNGLAGFEAPLVAPGQHVYVADKAAISTPPSGKVCKQSQPYPPIQTLPMALTGSSVSSVLVAAAQARYQRVRLQQGRVMLSAKELAGLLYLTGRPTCRTTGNGTPVRQLDLAAGENWLNSWSVYRGLACVRGLAGDGLIPPNLLAFCGVYFGANGSSSCTHSTSLVRPASYQSPVCRSLAGNTTFSSANSCGNPCSFGQHGTSLHLGDIGSQPGDTGCPDCPVRIDLTDPSEGRLSLGIELSGDFPPGTLLSDPTLVIEGVGNVSGVVESHYMNLLDISQPGDWQIGSYLHMESNFGSGPDIDWGTAKAGLNLIVEQPGKEPTENYSVLHLDVQ